MTKYAALAKILLDSRDPVTAIAYELGDQAGRIDALLQRLHHVEAILEQRKPGKTHPGSEQP